MQQGSVDRLDHDEYRTMYERKASNLDSETKISVTPTARKIRITAQTLRNVSGQSLKVVQYNTCPFCRIAAVYNFTDYTIKLKSLKE